MDKEKVITGLELCTDISPDGCKMLCPYRNEQDETYSGFCEQVLKRDALALLREKEAAYQGAEELLRQTTILFSDAIKRLKEYESVEPIKQIEEQKTEWEHLWDAPDGTFKGRCKKCGFVHFFIEGRDGQYKFCPECGRAVKLDD